MSWYQRLQNAITGFRAGDPRYRASGRKGPPSGEDHIRIAFRDFEELIRSHDSMDSIFRAEHYHLNENDGVITVHAGRDNDAIVNLVMMQLITAGYTVGDIEDTRSGRAYVPFRKKQEEAKQEPKFQPPNPHPVSSGPKGVTGPSDPLAISRWLI